jgi:hypothetical protein
MPPSAYDRFNHTELYQMCIRAKILVKPNTARVNLIAYLEGTEEPPEIEEDDNVFNSWRRAFIGFLLEYWRQIETQITCPARALKDPKNPNPRPCFNCIDTQVVVCLLQNHEAESLIEPHRLVRRPR